MKLISWNTNGIKARVRDGHLEELVKDENPDILCIQEVKTVEVPNLDGYTLYSFPSSEKKNLYGSAVYTKIKPLSVKKGLGDEDFDSQGRVIVLEFENFNLFNVYVPSGAGSKEKLNRKYRFYDMFTEAFKNSKKPVIVCGDFNRMAAEIDAERPELMKYVSGFRVEEREWFKEILNDYIDVFRHFHKEGGQYSWWQSKKLREKNSGIRLDYILASKALENTLNDSYIVSKPLGSDHAPVVMDITCCNVCGSLNEKSNEFCDNCGIKLSDDDEEAIVSNDKLKIPKDKIILLDLNYTLIANSWKIRNFPLEEKIKAQEYEVDLIDLIKDNYVILITASPYKRSFRILRDIREKTGFVPDESYWNFGGQPPMVKKYWMENEVLPQHGDNPNQYLAIESNPKTRRMYAKMGIEARPKGDFI